jgi:L-asparaginase
MPTLTQATTENILIIYTGGTIGMQPSDNGFAASKGFEQLLKDYLSEHQYSQLASSTILELDQPIDSSNATPADWYKIANCIADNYHNHSAFIVLHGTDTMAYSASAAHHLLGTNIKPVIFSGSQVPLSQPSSDAQQNILDAVAFAKQTHLNQVSICFNSKLLSAFSATKVHSSEFSAFNSPNTQEIAFIDNNTQEITFTQNNKQANTATIQSLSPVIINKLKNKSAIDKVGVLLLHPCISDQVIKATFDNPNTQAIVMLTYGAGNPPDQNDFLLETLKQARHRGVVVLNKSQCFQGSVAQGNYAVGSALNKLGVISAQDRTLEDLVTDLYINL